MPNSTLSIEYQSFQFADMVMQKSKFKKQWNETINEMLEIDKVTNVVELSPSSIARINHCGWFLLSGWKPINNSNINNQSYNPPISI